MSSREQTRPQYVTDMTCPKCKANDAVGLTSDKSFEEFKIGWCECGYQWSSVFGAIRKIPLPKI